MNGDIERYAKLLGSQREDVRRLVDAAARSSDGARIAKNVLRAKVRQAGMNPDDTAALPLVLKLPDGQCRVGPVLNGSIEGPIFSLPEGSPTTNGHIVVVGESRRGKSFLLLHVTRQEVDSGNRCWIFDLAGEYSPLVNAVKRSQKPLVLRPRHLRINVFEPPSEFIPWKSWLGDLCLLLREELFLRDGSLNLFDTEIRRLIEAKGQIGGRPQFPSLAEVLQHFNNLKFGGSKVRSGSWLESLTNRLGMLCNVFEETARVKSSNMLQQLAERSVIFHLAGLRGLPLQFLVFFCITWLARYQEEARS